MHLPGIRVAELADFEVDDDQATQLSMKKDQVDAKPVVVDAKPALTPKKSEIVA